MLDLIKICVALLPPAYSAAVALYALAFARPQERFIRWTRPALVVALLIHTTLIWAETMHFGHCLVYSPFEVMTLIAWMIALTYFLIEIFTKERGTGVFVLALSLLFTTLSQMFSPSFESGLANTDLVQDVVGLHISAAVLGYSAFTISAVYGALYVMLYHRIRSNRFGVFYERLPSLGLLERMSAVATVIGLVFLTAAIGIAFFWLPDVLPNFSASDPKVIATAVVWIIYAVAVVLKYVVRIDQRRFVLLSLIGFGGIFLSMTLVNTLLSAFHDFG